MEFILKLQCAKNQPMLRLCLLMRVSKLVFMWIVWFSRHQNINGLTARDQEFLITRWPVGLKWQSCLLLSFQTNTPFPDQMKLFWLNVTIKIQKHNKNSMVRNCLKIFSYSAKRPISFWDDGGSGLSSSNSFLEKEI